MSILRKAEYQELSRLQLEGRVIDLGGGKDAAYHRLFSGSFSIETANNNKDMRPDIQCDFEKPLPMSDAVYDGALLINVLEHIFEYRVFLSETARVLKHGGSIVVVVPYMFPYHASPNDFHRFSGPALIRALSIAGFTDIKVVALGTGVCAARWQLVERLLPAPLRIVSLVTGPLIRAADGILFALVRQMGKQYQPSDYALGFVVTAVKA